MLSCEPAGVMVQQSSNKNTSVSGGTTWIHPIIKQETPNGFLSNNSEGFHSASPSSSSRDSNQHSPRSVDSGSDGSPTFYESTPLQNRSQNNFSAEYHQALTMGFNPLTPPGPDTASRISDIRNNKLCFPQGHRSPINSMILNSHRTSTIGTPTANVTPPKSPHDNLISTELAPDNGEYDTYYERSMNEKSSSVKAETEKSDDGDDDSTGEDMDGDDEPGLRIPAVNSHGKVKTFKCKQCEFVAVTKLDFWEHSKDHIKPEKMLTCPKCPFVTEYKHHLEYHMRNHFGSKPFQCNQCNYSCVNKSMLNSHLKSHSNIYQYRCADCSYATKYCHSLKLHLRKYQHGPAMVLNQDGSPNPFPIIDVYGTRRGPKQKTQLKIQEEVHSQTISQSTPHPLFQNPFSMNFPYGPLLSHPLLFPTSTFTDNLPTSKLLDNRTSPSLEDRHCIDAPVVTPILQQRLLYRDKLPYTFNVPLTNRLPSPVRELQSSRPVPSPPKLLASSVKAVRDATDALDLTNFKHSGVESPTPSFNSSAPTPLTPTASSKNRRKGPAFKLERSSACQNDEEGGCDDETLPFDMVDSTSADTKMTDITTKNVEADSDSTPDEEQSRVANKSEDKIAKHTSKPSPQCYSCQFCDIIFKDVIMYTMHMGYHDYKDPFTCNMCGVRSADKVCFFIHIAKTQHS